MRKILLGLISILLAALAVYTAYYGITIGGLEINGIPAIQEENSKLDKKIENASKLRNSDYPQSVTLLESAYKKLMTEKENYEQILSLGVDENGETLNKIQEYEMERIWVVVGNYAKKQGVDLKIDVTSNNAISKTYDLNFTVTGGYIQITDFLYDMERDRTLVFKIENFKMTPGSSTDELVATFICKDIKLNITTTNTTETNQDASGSTTENTPNNTTNNTTNAGNTTNAENTTSNANSATSENTTPANNTTE